MKIEFLAKYVVRDLRAPRGKLEVWIGLYTIAFLMTALLLITTTTQGIHRFVDQCFSHAKPVIGTMHLTLRSGQYISRQQYLALRQSVSAWSDVESVSWIVNDLYNLPIRKTETEEFSGEMPMAWAAAADSPLFKEVNGFRLVAPTSPGVAPFNRNSQDLCFEVVLTLRYLEEFLGFKEQQIEDIVRRGKLADVPTEVFIHHAPIPALAAAYQPGTRSLPVAGVCTWRDRSAPHLFVSIDVAAAYHYGQASEWRAAYPLYFEDGRGRQLVSADEVLQAGKVIDAERVTRLPPKATLLEFSQFRENQQTPYRQAILFVKDYRTPDSRAELKKRIEAPIQLGHVPATSTAVKNLNERRAAAVAKWLTEQEAARSLADDNQRFVADDSQLVITVKSPGETWELFDHRGGQLLRVEKRGGHLHLALESPWFVRLPNDTASNTLNQVTRFVDFYSTICRNTVLLLTAIVALLVGVKYVHRKRYDIGLLKSHGMMPGDVGLIYAIQIGFIGSAGILVGLVFTVLIRLLVEPAAAELVAELNTGFVLDRPVMFLGLRPLVVTSGWIMLGTSVGMATAYLRALTLNPVEDLVTQT